MLFFSVSLGAFCIPVYIPYTLTGRWTLGRGLCKLWLVMDYLLCSASVFNIVLISYDRFLSVTRAVSRTSVSHLSNVTTAGMVIDVGRLHPSAVNVVSSEFSLEFTRVSEFVCLFVCFLLNTTLMCSF